MAYGIHVYLAEKDGFEIRSDEDGPKWVMPVCDSFFGNFICRIEEAYLNGFVQGV